MMKAEDLRVNNYILVDGIQDQVTGIFHEMAVDNEFYYVQASNKLDYSLDQVEPIPLDEEWLIKLGFTRSSSLSELWSQGNTMLIWRTEYESDELDNYYEFRFGITDSYGAFRQVRLDYVHQLQNLTHSLTGQDLTLSSLV